ncbi:MAG TPA: hypothetical protein VIQ97_00410 [Prevotella sp.]
MKQRNKIFMVLTALFMLSAQCIQADEMTKYKAFADTIRAYVWGMDMPQFKNTDVPKKYHNKSAVIVAAYRDLRVTQKSMLNVGSVFNLQFKVDRDVISKDLERVCIRINDQASLKKYSEFDFQTYYKRRNNGWKEKARHVLGVRIIKPNGTVKEISTDDYINTAEGKGDREKSQKLAVPGLAIGDNIDIFTYEEQKLEEHTLDPFVIGYQDDYPILWKRVHCEIDPDLTTQYRTLNGAPDFKSSTNENKDIVLDAEVSNVDTTDPGLWYSPVAHSPLTIINITGRRLKGEFIPNSTKKKGLQANPDVVSIQKDGWQSYDAATLLYYGNKELRKLCKKSVQQFPNISDRADYIYDLLRFTYLGERTTDAWLDRFTRNLDLRFYDAQIKNSKPALTTMRGSESIDQLANYVSTTTVLYLPDNNKFYTWMPAPTVAGELPISLQGRKAIMWKDKKEKDGPAFKEVVLPESKATDNQDIYTMKVSIENGTDVSIAHEQRTTGTMKQVLALRVVTLKDIYDSYLDRMTEKKPFEETLGKKNIAKEQEKVAKAKEEQQENMKKVIEEYWDGQPKELKDCRLTSVGTSAKEPATAFEAKYKMEGLVKKAGQNLILSTGKLLGDMLKVEGEARQRNADVDMISPRQTVWNIEIALPTGYNVSAEALKQLNQNVNNECASFVAKASTEAGKLLIHVVKTYNHGHEPAANWAKLLNVIDASNNYTTLQTVLKK